MSLNLSTDRAARGALYQLDAQVFSLSVAFAAGAVLERYAYVCGPLTPPRSLGGGLYMRRLVFTPRQWWLDRGGRFSELRDAIIAAVMPAPLGLTAAAVPALPGSAYFCQAYSAGSDVLGGAVEGVSEVGAAAVPVLRDVVEGTTGLASGLGSSLKSLGEGVRSIGEAQRIAPSLFGLLLLAGVAYVAVKHGPAILRSVR